MKRAIAGTLTFGAMTAMLLVPAGAAHAAGEPVATLVVAETVIEGTGGTNLLPVLITLDVPAPTALTVTLTTSDGSASSAAGEDFAAQTVGVTFLAGATGPATINIPIATDGVDEADETFSISLTPNSADVVVAGTPATVTILDDDEPLVATLSTLSGVVEGTGGTNILPVQIILSRPAPTSTFMTLTTTDGSASSVGGEDFTAQTVGVTFLAGAAGPATINIPITTDGIDELDETFSISLSTVAPGVTVTGTPHTVTILDDDEPLVATLSAPSTVIEGTGGVNLLQVEVTFSRPAPTGTTFTLATSDGSASSVGGEDFTAQTVAVTFLAGATGPATINIPITTDSDSESNETFSITLSTMAAGLTFSGAPHTVTILDDDDIIKPTVTIEQGAGQPDPGSSAPVTFDVAFDEPVSGFDGSDVTLTGTAGATTATVTGGPQLYSVAVTGMTQPGTVIATIGAGVASDGHGNTNVASTSDDNSVTLLAFSAPAAAGSIPVTGSDPTRTVLLAAALLVLGAAFVLTLRLKRRSRVVGL